MIYRSVWRNREWRARALTWAGRRLAERGTRVTGRPEQFHVRPWSTVIRLPTDRGAVYFKATWPPQRFEARLTAAVARWAPLEVGVPIAIDARRGWMLMEHSGTRLREVMTRDRDIRHWHWILPRYAELQLAITPHVRELVRLGLPDRRGARLADAYEGLLRDDGLLRVGLKEGLTKSQERKLRELIPQVRAWIAEFGIVPDTISHDDLHDGQVFVDDGRYRILDWGDACLSQPFLTMSVVERSVAYTLNLKPGSRGIMRLRDIYLEPFTKLASMKRLRGAYAIAIPLGWISRALTWSPVVRYLSPAQKRKERGDVPRSLGRFLDPTAA